MEITIFQLVNFTNIFSKSLIEKTMESPYLADGFFSNYSFKDEYSQKNLNFLVNFYKGKIFNSSEKQILINDYSKAKLFVFDFLIKLSFDQDVYKHVSYLYDFFDKTIEILQKIDFENIYDEKIIQDNDLNSYWSAFSKCYNKNNIELSDWVSDNGFCAFRYIKGTDPENVKNRVAFIEKTPRFKFFDSSKKHSDYWFYGTKGSTCSSDEDACEQQAYGFDPYSREWCDFYLKKLGYKLS